MGRLICICLIVTQLTGCAMISAVAAIPAALVDGMMGSFQSQEKTLPVSMDVSLAAVQKGLQKADMAVDILEPLEGEYFIAFGNNTLDGWMEMSRQTSSLTSVYIKIRKGVFRERAIEETVLDVIHEIALGLDDKARFDFSAYGQIFKQADVSSDRVGWYRFGALLKIEAGDDKAWQVVTMPSGASAYLPSEVLAKKAR